MNIFNSLGSNYTAGYVWSSFFSKKGAAEKLEELLRERYGADVLLLSKGRDAIQKALELTKIEKNSKVAVTGFTCIAVVDAVEKAGLTPVFLDIDPETLNFTANELESKLAKYKNIKAVIIQNTLGFPCDIKAIQGVCKKNKLILIEDLAHSIGTVYENGVEAGTVGDFTVLSFSQDKVVDAVSGGALIVRNQKLKIKSQEKNKASLKDRMYPLLTWTIRKTYRFGVGKLLHVIFKILHLLSDPMKNQTDSGMSEWHASMALQEFKNLSKNISHRRKIAQIYADNLDKKILSDESCGLVKTGTCLRFPIFVKGGEQLVSFLKKSGVHVSDIWYDAPVAPKKYIGLARYPKSTCPHAEKVSEIILNLPTHVNVTEKDALEISRLINQWLQK